MTPKQVEEVSKNAEYKSEKTNSRYNELVDSEYTKQKLNRSSALISELSRLNKKSARVLKSPELSLNKRVLLYNQFQMKAFNLIRKLQKLRVALGTIGRTVTLPKPESSGSDGDDELDSESDVDVDSNQSQGLFSDGEESDHEMEGAEGEDYNRDIMDQGLDAEDGGMEGELVPPHEVTKDRAHEKEERKHPVPSDQHRRQAFFENMGTIPKTYRQNAQNLAEHILTLQNKKDRTVLNFDGATGLVYFNGKPAPGSDVFQILAELSRDHKRSTPPKYYDQFLSAYQKLDPKMKYVRGGPKAITVKSNEGKTKDQLGSGRSSSKVKFSHNYRKHNNTKKFKWLTN